MATKDNKASSFDPINVPVELSPMQEEHCAAIAELEAICFSTPWSKTALESELQNPNSFSIVAICDSQLIGYGSMQCICGECYVNNIAVLPTFRGKGIGSAITARLILEAKNLNAAFISLEVRPSNPASALYAKLGFLEEGRRKRYYTHPVEDALIMTLHFE